jgi:hypothetical protein
MPADSYVAATLVGVATLFVGIGCCIAFVLRLRRRRAHLSVLLLRGAALLFQREDECGYSKLRKTRGRTWKTIDRSGAGGSRSETPGRPDFLAGRNVFGGRNAEAVGATGSNAETAIAPYCSLLLLKTPNHFSLFLLIAPGAWRRRNESFAAEFGPPTLFSRREMRSMEAMFAEPFDPQRTGPPRRLTSTAESQRSRRFAFPEFYAGLHVPSPLSARRCPGAGQVLAARAGVELLPQSSQNLLRSPPTG